MPDRLALKRLTRSDLTLFEAKYRTLNAGNQKAINLNADIFVDALFPNVPVIAPSQGNEIPLPISIFGPEGKGEDRLTRKIIKNPSYKNWRLDGEYIINPENDPTRYDTLQQYDLAIMSFDGISVPISLKLYLISQTGPADSALYNELVLLLQSRSMISLSPHDLRAAIDRARTAPDHPVLSLVSDPVLESAVEDAAFGGEVGARTLRTHGRRISAADLEKARANAGQIGRDGEGLINALFQNKITAGELLSADWIADYNAISSYDFHIVASSGESSRIDVKSTGGPFENSIHISMAELLEAATGPERYDIYRVYELNAEGGKLRIARDVREFAKAVIDSLNALPVGVRCDGFSVGVSATGLTWDAEMHISRPSGDDDVSDPNQPEQPEGSPSGAPPANSP